MKRLLDTDNKRAVRFAVEFEYIAMNTNTNK